MADKNRLIDEVLRRIHSGTPGQLDVIAKDEGLLMLRIGSFKNAVVGIRVSDPERPSFVVTYPALKVAKDGSREVTDVTAHGVLIDGVAWIVGQLMEHGVVEPEFG